MIAEDVLERGLRAAADRYDVPATGADGIRLELGQLAAQTDDAAGGVRRLRPRRPRSWKGWTAIAATAAALVIGVPLALGGSGGSGGGTAETAGSAVSTGGGGAGGNARGFVGFGGDVTGTARTPLRHQVQGRAQPKSVANGGAAAAGVLATPVPSAPPATGGATGSSSTGSSGTSLVPGSTADRVVKTGDLALRVPKGQVAASLQKLGDLAGQEGGYVAGSNQQTGGSDPTGQVTLRVPVARFTDTVDRASHIAGAHVLSLQTSGQDVTSQYVDLSARITALERVRASYLTLLGRANSIGQTLEVQDRIADVQSQIERLQGQRKVLADQAAMSTLDVTVDQPAPKLQPAAHHHRSTGFGHAVHVSVDRFVRGVDAIVSILGPLLLAVILVGLAVLAGRFGLRRFRRHLV